MIKEKTGNGQASKSQVRQNHLGTVDHNIQYIETLTLCFFVIVLIHFLSPSKEINVFNCLCFYFEENHLFDQLWWLKWKIVQNGIAINIFKYKTTLCETTVFGPFHSKIEFIETNQKLNFTSLTEANLFFFIYCERRNRTTLFQCKCYWSQGLYDCSGQRWLKLGKLCEMCVSFQQIS